MTTAVEILDRAPTLEDLERTIRTEHEACIGSLRATIGHAIRAGDALLTVREQLMHTNKWTAWVRGADFISYSQAYTYMRIAVYRDHLPQGIGIQQAERMLIGLPSLDGSGARPRLPDPVRADARRMRDEGLGYKEIAKRLEVSPSTVHNWFNGTSKAHARRAREALRKQNRDKRIQRAIAKTGGALAEAYSMAERLDDVIGQAHREATEAEARRELAKAHEFYRAMRDSIVRGLGVEL